MAYKNIAAVDISDDSIKVLQLDEERHVTAFGSSTLKPGVVKNGLIVDAETFAGELCGILAKTRPKPLYPSRDVLLSVASLPDSQVYVHHAVAPMSLADDSLRTFAEDEAAKIVPIALSDMYATYHVAEEDGERHVVFVGAPKSAVENYVEALTHAGMRPVMLGGGFFSLGRALLPDELGDADRVIVDMGAHATTIGVFTVDAIASFTTRIHGGGTALTEEVARTLKVDTEKAEQMKRDHGVRGVHNSHKVSDVLKTCLVPVVTEIRHVIAHHDAYATDKVAGIVLAGGSALMPGVVEYIEKETGVPTVLGEPFKKLNGQPTFEANTHPLFFAGVVGLALRAFDDDLPGINLLSNYRWDSTVEDKVGIPLKDVRSVHDAFYVVHDLFNRSIKLTRRVAHLLRLDMRVDVRLVGTVVLTLAALGGLWWVLQHYL